MDNKNNNITLNSQVETDISHYSTIYEQEEENQEHHDSTNNNNNNNKNEKDETIDIEAMAAAITAAVQSTGRGTSSMALGNASIISNRVRSQSESTRSTIRRSSSSSSSNKQTFFLPNNNNRIIPQDAMAPRPKRSSSMSSQHSLPPSLINSTSTSTRSRSSSSASRHNYSARFSWLVGTSTMINNNDGNQHNGQQQQQTRVGQEPTIMEEEKSTEPSVDDGRRELMYRGIQVKEMKTTLKTMVIPHEVENPMPKVELQRPGFARINY